MKHPRRESHSSCDAEKSGWRSFWRTMVLVVVAFMSLCLVGLLAAMAWWQTTGREIGESFGRLGGEPIAQIIGHGVKTLEVLEPFTIEPEPAQLKTFELSSDDYLSYGRQVLGTWQAVAYEGKTWDGINALVAKSDVTVDYKYWMTLKENGEYRRSWQSKCDGQETIESEEGTYHIDRNQLVMNSTDGQAEVALMKIKKGTLILQDTRFDLRILLERSPPEGESGIHLGPVTE